ncbi:hypothetical protein [Streptomyces sp. NPDC051684]|uniref:hypothetical protein n=1 Tax=Streptomyces sp. NPDC051684 TaxID=3365670 RepID=UPI0037B749D1
MTPRTPPVHPADQAERPVEQRLREALAVRADSVTVRALRPARPPGPQLRRLPRLRDIRRRFALPVAGLATAAALAVGYVALSPDPDQGPSRTPVPPAAPSSSPAPDRSQTPSPAPSTPSGTAVPTPATPSPSSPPTSSPPTEPAGERPSAGASSPG